VLSVTYAHDLLEALARKSRGLMQTPFYQALFDSHFERTGGRI
jgi:hypothetical protein